MKTLLQVLQQSTGYLETHGIECARTDSEWLVAHALGLARIDLYLQFDRPLNEEELGAVRPLLRRRVAGEPVQYIVGSTEFYGCEVLVGPGVLIPRPETERLVDVALERYGGAGPVLDVCTGSGAILLALAAERADLHDLVGVDCSAEALSWARRNVENLSVADVSLVEGDLFEPVRGKAFGLITANPPYVRAGERGNLAGEIREHEPAEALFAGADGLDVMRRLAAEVAACLEPGGVFVGEIGWDQGEAAADLFAAGGLSEVEVIQDYGRRDRVVTGVKPAG